jgi:hypothetical protein
MHGAWPIICDVVSAEILFSMGRAEPARLTAERAVIAFKQSKDGHPGMLAWPATRILGLAESLCGRPENGLRRIDAEIAKLQSHPVPVAMGLLHEAAALIGEHMKDGAVRRYHAGEMARWVASTENPVLLERHHRTAARQIDGVHQSQELLESEAQTQTQTIAEREVRPVSQSGERVSRRPARAGNE